LSVGEGYYVREGGRFGAGRLVGEERKTERRERVLP